MGTLSTQPKCIKGMHKFKKDLGDKRFKICKYCGCTEYRTDQEVEEGKP